MNDLSTYLAARPSFAEGVARLMDLGGTMSEYNRSATPEEADYQAAWLDWSVVAADMRVAIERAKAEAEAEV